MNIFQRIQETEPESIDRAFILAETELAITVEQANHEFMYESGLISLNNNIFTEASDAKSENVFVRAFKAICNGIRNFFKNISDAISNLFDTRENIDPNEYFKSPNTKLHFEKDVRKMDAVVDDEIRKGNTLLQKAASATGCDDAEIESWIDNGKKKLTAVAATTIPVVVAWGLKNAIPKMLKRKTKAVDDAEATGSKSDNKDPKKNKQKMTIMSHISDMVKTFGSSVKDLTSKLEKEPKDPEYEQQKEKINKSYDEENKRYNSGQMNDKEHLEAMRKLGDSEKRSAAAHEERVAERRRKAAELKEAQRLRDATIDEIDRGIKRGNISKGQRSGKMSFINRKFIEYKSDKLSFNDFKSALNSVK